jgi:hypothetical protein
MKLAEDFTCLECKVSFQLLNNEQLYNFHEEIKQFFNQYESCYFSFEYSLGITIARQAVFAQKFLPKNKKLPMELRQEFETLRLK